MGEDLNVSVWIFRCETPYTWIFGWKKSVHVRINFRTQKLVHIFTDFPQKSVQHVRITYIWEYLWMFACLSTHVTVILNFGA